MRLVFTSSKKMVSDMSMDTLHVICLAWTHPYDSTLHETSHSSVSDHGHDLLLLTLTHTVSSNIPPDLIRSHEALLETEIPL